MPFFFYVLFFFIVFFTSKEVLIFNEEYLLIVNFLIFFYCAFHFIGLGLQSFLDLKLGELKINFVTLYHARLTNLLNYAMLLKKYFLISNITSSLFVYSKGLQIILNQSWLIFFAQHVHFLIETKLLSFYKLEIKFLRDFFSVSIFLTYNSLLFVFSQRQSMESDKDIVDVLQNGKILGD